MNGKEQIKEFYGSSVFSKYGLVALPCLLILSFIYGLKELVWISLSCFVILLFSRIWAARSLKDLVITESIPMREVFHGEEIQVRFEVHNNKRLPVAWLNLETGDFQKENEERLRREEEDGRRKPEIIETKSNYVIEVEKESASRLFEIGWISGQESLTVQQSLKGLSRGVYKVGTSKIRSGDPFLLFCCEQPHMGSTEVLVYPPLLDFPWPDFGRKYPNGNIADKNVVFTDPAYKIGIKDYEPSDSLRSINWAASARYQALKTNIPEGKAVSRCVIFLDATNFEHGNYLKGRADLAWELLVSGVASLAFHLSSLNKEWSFATNVLEEKAQKNQRYVTGSNSTSSHHQLRSLLVRLACLDLAPSKIAPDNLQRVKGQSGVTLILFSVVYDPILQAKLLQTTPFKQIKWFVLEENPISEGMDVYALRPGWADDGDLYKQLIGKFEEKEGGEAG